MSTSTTRKPLPRTPPTKKPASPQKTTTVKKTTPPTKTKAKGAKPKAAKEPQKKGLSTGAKWGIGLGVAALIIIIIVIIAITVSAGSAESSRPDIGSFSFASGSVSSGTAATSASAGNVGVISYGFTGPDADSTCPTSTPEIVKDPTDLNSGAGGDFIFLCTQTGEQGVEYVSGQPVVEGVTDFTVVVGTTTAAGTCQTGWTRDPTNLNGGVDDVVHINACALIADGTFLARIYVVAAADSADANCDSGDTKVDTDLNQGAGGFFVYFCTATQ